MDIVPKLSSVPNGTLSRIDANFSLKPSCSICTLEYNEKDRAPKILDCGHTFCSACLKRSIDSNKHSYSGEGDGEVYRHLACFTCRAVTPVNENKKDFGFSTNFQLLEVMKPSDVRTLKCNDCLTDCNENMFQVCRECTLEKFKFDVTKIHEEDSVIDPDQFAICSSCIINSHMEHSYAQFYPIRRYWQVKTVLRDVNVAKANYNKYFEETRVVLAKTPNLVQKLDEQASRMVEIMSRAKSSHQLKYMEKRFKDEMTRIVTTLDGVKKGLGKLNEDIEKNTVSLRDENDNLNGSACDTTALDIEAFLEKFKKLEKKIKPDTTEQQVLVEEPPGKIESRHISQTPYLLVRNILELVWLSISWTVKVTLEETKNMIEQQGKEVKVFGTTTVHSKFIVFSFSFMVIFGLLAMLLNHFL